MTTPGRDSCTKLHLKSLKKGKRMLERSLVVTLVMLISICTRAQEQLSGAGPQAAAEKQILDVLNLQVKAWNAGDIEGFMRGYWNSTELTFFSGGTVTKGWQPTLERYRKRYQGEGREMGQLEFRELQVTVLSSDAAIARGRWRLALSQGKEAGGLFTLVLRRKSEGWRIVHDHTSSE
jgi:ketosteroid isomerase-like protein